MTKVISLINLKGGVGKTTTTVALADCLAYYHHKRVLVVDLDPQMNSTIALIGEKRWKETSLRSQTLYHLFNDLIEKGETTFDARQAIVKHVGDLRMNGGRLDLLASDLSFASIQDDIHEITRKTDNDVSPHKVIETFVSGCFSNYDYVLIDCPPSLGTVTKNGIFVSDYYLIPTIPDVLSTYGVPQIVQLIDRMAQKRGLKVQCLGLLFTKVRGINAHKDGRSNMEKQFPRNFRSKPAPIFENYFSESSCYSDITVKNFVRTFKQKYERGASEVISVTNEFLSYAG